MIFLNDPLIIVLLRVMYILVVFLHYHNVLSIYDTDKSAPYKMLLPENENRFLYLEACKFIIKQSLFEIGEKWKSLSTES